MNPALLLKNSDKTKTVVAGDTILRQGRHSYLMYVVLEGEVDVLVNGALVESLGRGGVFGEMSLVDPAPCSATVVAKTDASLASIDKPHFELLVQEHPAFALHIMEVMARRLRRMDSRNG